jgi:beta-galactosidase/beta-glucuronidase
MANYFTLITFSLIILIYSIYYKVWLNPGSNLIQIYTPWGENLDKDNILQEYPRPQFQRDSYLNLNGKWKYALREKGKNLDDKYDGDILVPFSIESPLSGVGKSLKPGMTLFYNRKIDLTKIKNNGRFLLNFGAVDQETDVYINGKHVGNHKGGYLSFSFDITEYVQQDLSNVDLLVRVFDNLKENGEAYGKQANPRGNIYYITTGGIWQTVWIESVPNNYLKNVKMTPFYDDGKIEFEPECIVNNEKKLKEEKIKYLITDKTGKSINGEIPLTGKSLIEIPKPIFSWSPEEPNLYQVKFTFGEDIVSSYFAMRKFSISEDSRKIKRLFLNNKPYFHIGVLDQGYWSDGFYTAPSDEALKYDIIKMKEMGFNMLRKHIKVEPMRWYYYCDTLGMIVWQDMISGGSFYNPVVTMITPLLKISLPDSWYSFFGRGTEESRNTYYRELKEMILQLYNVPSISTWVPFNEGWGQFDALKSVDFIKELDTTRYIDHASGFHDQYGGDFLSLHIYFGSIDFGEDKYGRVHALSEFGGYSYIEEGHCGSDHHFGYFKYESKEDLNAAYKDLIIKGVIPAIPKGLSATVYTQLSDVEDEVNGFMTYDRKVLKMDANMVKELNSLIQFLD